MRRTAFAIALMMAVPAHAEGVCGNWAFNIVRATECLSYTTDWQKHQDLKDKRLQMISEWTERNPNAVATLELMLKEGQLRMASALARDLKAFPDEDMYKSKGCAELPVCVAKLQQSVDAPRKVKTETVEPEPKPQRVNTRTGGKWCGPRDRRAGYCNWNGWLR